MTLSQNFTKPEWKIIKCTNKSSLTSLRIDETWTKCDWRQPRTKNNTWSSLCSPSTKSLPTENWPQQGLVVILDSWDIIPSRWRYPETGIVTYCSYDRLLAVFCDVTPYILVNRYQLFRAMCCFYPLDRKVSLTKKMETVDSSVTQVSVYQSTQHHAAEDCKVCWLYSHYHENLKSHTVYSRIKLDLVWNLIPK